MWKIIKWDCLSIMCWMDDNSVDLTLTDIPYNEVNRPSNWLNVLDKWKADILTFDLVEFCNQVIRITKSSVIIFCWQWQFSYIYNFLKQKKGTTRQLIWKKSNPSPMNGKHIYLSWIENAIWFKKPNWTFNAHCKNTVFKYPNWSSKLHPTEKNHWLLKELILDNSNEWDLVFDPCCWSGSHLLVAKENGRDYLWIELDEDYYNVANERLK